MVRKSWVASLALSGLLAWGGSARGAALYGTLSNFDVYNDTPEDAYGYELELEGVHKSDIYGTYPAHYATETATEYVNGTTFGTRIVYSGYNFGNAGFLAPTANPQSTNGHFCVGTAGCEHFGFSLGGSQPTATRTFWLRQDQSRINATPTAIPSPSWTYVPPAVAGGQPVLRAEVEVPKAENEVQKPNSLWMKVYKTKVDRAVDLLELMSDNALIPDDAAETETEWELLEGGKMGEAHDNLKPENKAIIRRYEYFKYTGAYDPENEPLSAFLAGNLLEPPVGELGDFIAANMVAANLELPAVALQGDFNADGAVDGADLLAWQQQAGQNNFPHADEDHDGHVDGDDLKAWKHGRNFFNDDGGNGGPGPGSAAVAEPATLLPALLALAGFAARRRREASTESD